MDHETWCLQRLQIEIRDWTVAVRHDLDGGPAAHRDSIQNDPEVWDRD